MTLLPHTSTGRRRALLASAASVALAGGLLAATQGGSIATAADDAGGPVGTSDGAARLLADVQNGLRGQILGRDIIQDTSTLLRGGKEYWLKNHLDSSAIPTSLLQDLELDDALVDLGLGGADSGGEVADDGIPREYLVVWAGDHNILDRSGAELLDLPKSIGPDQLGPDHQIGPDFFAVVDATEGSPSYGEVVNTATVGPLVENEPHHMQYIWGKGDNIFAGGLFTDVTYVVDTSQLPKLTLTGINLPQDTLCGSVPDAYWVTEDHQAYGTYMGGPDLPGPCTYSDGSVRLGNGFGGSPGEMVRLDENGRTLWEAPATPEGAETELRCDNVPALQLPTCANPHGVQAREDLGILISSDYNEPRNIILNPVQAPSSYLRRPTVRTWDISDLDKPKLKAVSFLPDGPRQGRVAHHEENRAIMEVTVTNLPDHKGAFVTSMQGGAVYYTPDITLDEPQWQQVFDLTTSNKAVDPSSDYYGGGSNAGWTQTSLDDDYLYVAVVGRPAGRDTGASPQYVLKLDVRELMASGADPSCVIDSDEEIENGGEEADCPTIHDALPAPGGPHWGALDNLELGEDGKYRETTDVNRIAYSNYFVARTGLDGDHRVCMVDVNDDETLSLDTEFKQDGVPGEGCIEFDRTSWPHGEWGAAKPHSMLFVTADDDIVEGPAPTSATTGGEWRGPTERAVSGS